MPSAARCTRRGRRGAVPEGAALAKRERTATGLPPSRRRSNRRDQPPRVETHGCERMGRGLVIRRYGRSGYRRSQATVNGGRDHRSTQGRGCGQDGITSGRPAAHVAGSDGEQLHDRLSLSRMCRVEPDE